MDAAGKVACKVKNLRKTRLSAEQVPEAAI
jgi:hypothetical protein